MFAKVRCTCSSCGFLLILLTNLCVLAAAQNVTNVGLLSPPLEFPKNESLYPFKHNETFLEALIAHTSNDTEVDDLLHGGLFTNISLQQNTMPEVPAIPTETDKAASSASDKSAGNRKWDAELIEDGSKTEETKANNDSAPIKSVRIRDSYGSKMPVVQGQLAAILAGVLVVLAVLGYAALLSWRRFLEGRYGNREMLVNEEDFYDPNDMRHFSLDSRVQHED